MGRKRFAPCPWYITPSHRTVRGHLPGEIHRASHLGWPALPISVERRNRRLKKFLLDYALEFESGIPAKLDGLTDFSCDLAISRSKRI